VWLGVCVCVCVCAEVVCLCDALKRLGVYARLC
jgi:hypothetical protein